jgi:hypothetical protein
LISAAGRAVSLLGTPAKASHVPLLPQKSRISVPINIFIIFFNSLL